MSKLRVGIAGYGVVGSRRRHFIDLNPHLQTVAVCDQKYLQAGTFEDGVRYYPTYEGILQENLDVIFVCLVNSIAAEVTMAGLEKGLHVFCEKPPGRDLNDIAKVIAVAKKYPQQKLKYGFNHRYHESVLDALDKIRSKELGEIINLRGVYGKSKIISFGQNSDWRVKRSLSGGGILLDQGIHMVDLIRLFSGEFTEVHSFVSNDFWKHNIEDNAYAIMKTKDGKVAMLHSTATQWKHRFDLDICLEGGSLILGGILSSSKSYGCETLTVVWRDESANGEPREQTTRYNIDPSWKNEIAEFVDAIVYDKPVIHGTVMDAFFTMQLVYQIYCADLKWKSQWNLSDVALDPQLVIEAPGFSKEV